MNIITMVVGNTRRVWLITVSAAAVNVLLNLLLVPAFGTLAAAINTTIGYGFLLLGVFLYSRRMCHPPIDWESSRIAVGVGDDWHPRRRERAALFPQTRGSG